jgi:hypothetical protein
MKVLNLCCAQGHGFEGWFGSEDDFQSQRSRRLVTCPLCGDPEVSKLPSAPRLNLSGARDPAPVVAAPGTAAAAAASHPAATAASPAAPAAGAGVPAELQALWMKAVQQVMANTEDVGERFPEEARRMHYGESPHRGIRGQATPEERAELAEEGIEVVPLPLPPGLKGPVQ